MWGNSVSAALIDAILASGSLASSASRQCLKNSLAEFFWAVGAPRCCASARGDAVPAINTQLTNRSWPAKTTDRPSRPADCSTTFVPPQICGGGEYQNDVSGSMGSGHRCRSVEFRQNLALLDSAPMVGLGRPRRLGRSPEPAPVQRATGRVSTVRGRATEFTQWSRGRSKSRRDFRNLCIASIKSLTGNVFVPEPNRTPSDKQTSRTSGLCTGVGVCPHCAMPSAPSPITVGALAADRSRPGKYGCQALSDAHQSGGNIARRRGGNVGCRLTSERRERSASFDTKPKPPRLFSTLPTRIQNANLSCAPMGGWRSLRPNHGERSCCSANVSRDAIRWSVPNSRRTTSGQLHSWLRCRRTM